MPVKLKAYRPMVSSFLLFNSYLKPYSSHAAHLFLLIDGRHQPGGVLVLSVDSRSFTYSCVSKLDIHSSRHPISSISSPLDFVTSLDL